MKRWVRRVMAIAACMLLAGTVADAQPAAGPQPGTEFGIRAAPAGPRPGIRLEPTRPPEVTRAREQEFYPGYLIRSRYEPAFVQPFVREFPVSRTSAARVGLSGWTAPAVPYDIPQATGGVAFGLTIAWGIPRPEAKAPEAERGDQR